MAQQEVPETITIPVTQEMLADLKDGTEVGFVWEGQGCSIRIVMSPAFSALVIDVPELAPHEMEPHPEDE